MNGDRETIMVKGVEFVKFTDEDEEWYQLLYPNGELEPEGLSEVYSRGNFTMGRTRSDGAEVMIDDDGIHREWSEK